MGVYEARGQLAKAMKDLTDRWNNTKGDWDDVVSEAFEEKFLLPLEIDLRNATGAMDHASQVLSQVRRDCQ